jgi:hypothetical protein
MFPTLIEVFFFCEGMENERGRSSRSEERKKRKGKMFHELSN